MKTPTNPNVLENCQRPQASPPAPLLGRRLRGRCRNCGGVKRGRWKWQWYCEDCRNSLNIPKREWVRPNAEVSEPGGPKA